MNAGFVYQIPISCELHFDTLHDMNRAFLLDTDWSTRKHLIVSIGSEVYVTLPKGQIIPTQSAAEHVDVPGGGHVLIVPITHYPTFTTIPPDLTPPIVEETEK